MWPKPQFPSDLITFTEEILNEQLHVFCNVVLKLWFCPFKILFSILSALISSAKSEYDGRDMFSSFLQYEWSSDAKGVADQL